MSDFTKAKIGFAVALLVALFTIHPVLVTSAGITITVFSAPVKLVWLYYTVIGLFSLSVYVYALAFLSNLDESLAERFGNFLYAAALLTPVLCLLVWFLSRATELLLRAIPQIPLILTSIVSGIFGAVAATLISRRLNTRDRESKAEALDREESYYMERATKMLQGGYVNAAVIQAFQAIELAVRRALLIRGIAVRSRATLDIMNAAISAQIIPFAARDDVHFVRELRNHAAHDAQPIPLDQGREALEKAKSVLAIINRRDEDEREVA